MLNQHAIEDVHVIQQSAASHEPARVLSAGGEQDEQSALLRALLVRGISGAIGSIAHDAVK
jgi:hypothetical protein